MTFIEILLLAVALSMDACAVCLAASTAGQVPDRRSAFRLAFHFGLFQFLMPVIGWILGRAVLPIIDGFDHWLAFGLLAFIGLRMLRLTNEETPSKRTGNPSRGLTLVLLSTATSIDALVVGLSLAVVGVSIWYPGAVVGLVTALICVVAIKVGTRLQTWFGPRAQVVGGLVLIAIGTRILVSGLS